jgi:hypothetical protein
MVSRFISAVALTGLLAAPAASDEVKSPTLIYSPWIKFCLGETCFIGKDGRSDCDPVVAAVLIERKGETKKTLRVTLPTRVNVERGVRIIVDQDQPIDRPYGCLQIGHASILDQAHRLKLELAGKLPSLHDPPPAPLKHLTRCLRNRVQATFDTGHKVKPNRSEQFCSDAAQLERLSYLRQFVLLGASSSRFRKYPLSA